MFETGNLLYFNPFLFPDGGKPKPKYFLVLAKADDNVLLASLPTSKDHVPADVAVEAGCLEMPERMVNVYVMPADMVVTDSGFSFRVNTFIYGANVKTYDQRLFVVQIEELQTEVSLIGKMTDDIFSDLCQCLKDSDAVRKRYKKYL